GSVLNLDAIHGNLILLLNLAARPNVAKDMRPVAEEYLATREDPSELRIRTCFQCPSTGVHNASVARSGGASEDFDPVRNVQRRSRRQADLAHRDAFREFELERCRGRRRCL